MCANIYDKTLRDRNTVGGYYRTAFGANRGVGMFYLRDEHTP